MNVAPPSRKNSPEFCDVGSPCPPRDALLQSRPGDVEADGERVRRELDAVVRPGAAVVEVADGREGGGGRADPLEVEHLRAGGAGRGEQRDCDGNSGGAVHLQVGQWVVVGAAGGGA
jgi:hypothetical protein